MQPQFPHSKPGPGAGNRGRCQHHASHNTHHGNVSPLLDEGFESRVLPCSLPPAGSWHRRRDIFQLVQKSVFSPAWLLFMAPGWQVEGLGWVRGGGCNPGALGEDQSVGLRLSCRGASRPRCSQGTGTSRLCSPIPNPAGSRSKPQAKAFLKASAQDGPVNPRPAFHLPLIPGQH